MVRKWGANGLHCYFDSSEREVSMRRIVTGRPQSEYINTAAGVEWHSAAVQLPASVPADGAADRRLLKPRNRRGIWHPIDILELPGDQGVHRHDRRDGLRYVRGRGDRDPERAERRLRTAASLRHNRRHDQLPVIWADDRLREQRQGIHWLQVTWRRWIACAVWYKFTSVSDVLSASITRHSSPWWRQQARLKRR